MRKRDKSDSLDYALKVLFHPILEDSEEFGRWIRDKRNRRLYSDLKMSYDRLALEQKELPDVRLEWERFKEKDLRQPPVVRQTRRKNINIPIRFWQRSAAAVLLLTMAFCAAWLYKKHLDDTRMIPVVSALPYPQEVVLSSDKGEQYYVSKKTDTISLAGVDIDNVRHSIAYNDVGRQQQQVEMHTLRTPRGKNFQVTLSDGTKVWLNAESQLRYPTRFDDSERRVELEGEAYFQVHEDAGHPFVVQTEQLSAKVLGTSFNFRSYQHADTHLTLVEGKVAVNVRGNADSWILSPGQDVYIDSDGCLKIQDVDTRTFTAWIEGYYYFDNVTLAQIMRELGHWYNVNIYFKRKKPMDYRLNLWVFRDSPLDTVLEQLNQFGKVHATLSAGTIIIE